MARNFRQDIRQQAAVVRARLEDKSFPTPKTFTAYAKAFIATQARFEGAAAVAATAETARDDALEAVGVADDGLDASLDAYADAISAAKLGPRVNPFKPFSKHAPSALKDLAYATEVEQVRALVASVTKKKPPASVAKAGSACLARATAVEKALAALGKPATAYQRALAARDARLPEMQKALKTIKAHAASAFVDDPATLAALFAPPEAVQAPRRRRAKKATPVLNGAPAGDLP